MRLKIRLSTITLGFFLFLYYRPANYVIGAGVDKVCLFILCLMSLICFVSAIIRYSKGLYHPTRAVVCLVAFFGWCMIGSTFINYFLSGNISMEYAITYFLCELGIVVVSDVQLEKNPKRYLELFVTVGGFQSILNIVTVFAYGSSGGLNAIREREGRTISQNFFLLAEDNATFFLTWPVLVLSWILYFKFKHTKKMLFWCVSYSALLFASYIYTWSAANIISIAVTIILILLYWRAINRHNKIEDSKFGNVSQKRKLSGFNLYWILAFIFNYLLIAGNLIVAFSSLISGTLKKSLTLSGRTLIWERAIHYILEQFIIGYGCETRAVTLSKIIFNHVHNIMLEILYRGGLIGMILFIFVMLSLGRKSKNYGNDPMIRLLGLCIVLFIFQGAIEFAFYRYPYIVLFVLLGRCEILSNKRNYRNMC